MPIRQQAIIWTNDGLVCWCIYASLGLNELTCCEILGLKLGQNRTDTGSLHPLWSNSASTLAHLLVFIVIFCPCQGMHHVRVGGFGVDHEEDQQETEAELLDRAAKGDFREDMKEFSSTECSALVEETQKDSTQNIPGSQQSLMTNGNVKMKWANREEHVISTNWVNYLCDELFSRFIFNKYTMKTMKEENSLVSIISANDPGDIFSTSWANLTDPSRAAFLESIYFTMLYHKCSKQGFSRHGTILSHLEHFNLNRKG